MKKKYLPFTLIILLSCKSQNISITKEKIDISKYKNFPLHPGVLDNQNSGSHIYLDKKKEIQTYEDDKIISIQENLIGSPYKSQKLYSKKTHLLTREQIQFYNFSVGKTKIYDDNGILINTIDCDEKYSFSINQLIEKMKKEYKIDFSTRSGNGKSIHRNFINGKYCYDILIWLSSSAKERTKNIIVDGNTGEVLSETNHNYNDENDPRI